MPRTWLVVGLSAVLSVPAFCAAAKTASAPASAAATHAVIAQRWAAQNLNGTVSMVDPKMDLVVVRDSSGVPFDFTVAGSTRIDKGAQREELSQLTPKESVSVRYVPEARGDIARTIQVNH